MRKRVPMRFPMSLTWLLLIALMAVGLSACRGRHARRYQRLRRELPDSYRLCLFPVQARGEKGLAEAMADCLHDELARTGAFRMIGPVRAAEALAARGIDSPYRLDEESLARLGDEMDCDAFLRTRCGEDPDGSLRLDGELINAYSGNVIWHRGDLLDRSHAGRLPARPVARRRIATSWVEALMRDMSKLVRLQQTLLRVPSEDGSLPEGLDEATGKAAAGRGEVMSGGRDEGSPVSVLSVGEEGELEFPGLRPDGLAGGGGPWRLVPPSWGAGCEAVELRVPDWSLEGLPPVDGGTRFVSAWAVGPGSVRMRIELGDHGTPDRAARWLEDRCRGLGRQRLEERIVFAHRDGAGRAVLHMLLARYVVALTGDGARAAEVVALARAIARANEGLVAWYRAHPLPPEAEPRERVVVQTRVKTVEIPKVVVPRVVIRLDRDELLELLDRGAGAGGERVYSLPPRPTRPTARTALPVAVAPSAVRPAPRRTEPAAVRPDPTDSASTAPVEAGPARTVGSGGDGGGPRGPEGADEDEASAPASASPAAMLHESMGRRWFAMGKFEAARDEFLLALEADPSFRRARMQLRRLADEHGIEVAASLPSEPTPSAADPVPVEARPAPSAPDGATESGDRSLGASTPPAVPTTGTRPASPSPEPGAPSPPVVPTTVSAPKGVSPSRLPTEAFTPEATRAPVPPGSREEDPLPGSDRRATKDLGALAVVALGVGLLLWVAFGGGRGR